MTASRPSISVILSAIGSFSALETTIARLCDQTIRDQIELVLVGPSQQEPSWAPEIRRRFHGLVFVWEDPFVSIGASNAAGVKRAGSEVVVLGEDHCFPEPNWAEVLVAAHREPWAGVGPQVISANPASGVSRADFLIGYSPWAAPCKSGEVEILPGHNSSYKRSVLIEYGDALADFLQAETVLHYDLSRKGKKLYLDSRARTAHVNYSVISVWLPIQYMQGRVFASERRRSWPLGLRVAFAAASPLIPAVRFIRITRQYFSESRPAWVYLTTMPYLALGLAVDGFGQFVGYVAGWGGTLDRIKTLEFQRCNYINDSEREALFPPGALESRLQRKIG